VWTAHPMVELSVILAARICLWLPLGAGGSRMAAWPMDWAPGRSFAFIPCLGATDSNCMFIAATHQVAVDFLSFNPDFQISFAFGG